MSPIFILFTLVSVVSASATNKKPENPIAKRRRRLPSPLWLFLLFVVHVPIESKGRLLDFLVFFGVHDGFAVMQVVESVFHAQMHLALLTVEVVDVV